MNDLISRKEAINVIEDTEDCVCSYVAIALGDAINKIAKLPPSSQWIPCSEQLPKYKVRGERIRCNQEGEK